MFSGLLKKSRATLIAVLAVVVVGNAVSAQPDANEALKQAIISGDLNAVKQAVAQGASVNYKGALPLYIAAGNNRFEIVKFLISAGANVNGVRTSGPIATPLRLAAGEANRTGNYRMVNYLLSVGADPAAGGIRMHSPLTVAVMTGHLDQVKKVVTRSNSSLDHKEGNHKTGNGQGMTALMIAAQHGFGGIVQYLLEQGARVNIWRKCGEAALYYAAGSNQVQIVKHLLRKGAEVNPKLPAGCKNSRAPILITRDIEIYRLLLEAGARPNVVTNTAHYWSQPIALAVRACWTELVELLIRHGSEFEDALKEQYRNKCGKNPPLGTAAPAQRGAK